MPKDIGFHIVCSMLWRIYYKLFSDKFDEFTLKELLFEHDYAIVDGGIIHTFNFKDKKKDGYGRRMK